MMAASSQSLAFGAGALPFILFLMAALGVGIACCFANSQSILEWAAGMSEPAYQEIRNPPMPV